MKNGIVYKYSLKEEIASTITHGVMSVLCLFSLPFAAIWAFNKNGILASVGVSIFVISILLMFLGSTLYHCMADETKHKNVFHILDHIFIYVAIAGTYTPIALYVIGGWQGIVIAAVQWICVISGILYKSLAKNRIPKASIIIYLVMGWALLFFLPLFLKNADIMLIIFVALGGVFYSIGSVFYAKKAFVYHHMVWHFFVNLGALSHFIGIVFFL